MSRRAFIYAAGDYKSNDIKLYKRIKLRDDDLVICADGGYDMLAYTSIVPNVVIGDLDSIRSTIPNDIKVIKYPSDKDKTDLEICIDYAIEHNCDTLFFLGVWGGRKDHSIGALHAMRYAFEKGADSMILTADSRIYLVSDELVLEREDFEYVSLIPCTDVVRGVTTHGLKYELENASLKQGSSLGISNEFYNNRVSIKIEYGLLYVVCIAE